MRVNDLPADIAEQLEGNTTADILRRARAMCDTPAKWGRSLDYKTGGRSCPGYAINMVSGFRGDAAGDLFMDAVGLPRDTVFGIPDWNDAPGRTHAEVMAAFDRAIALAEQEHSA